MSLCGVCHLDSKKHSKKLWVLHQQTQFCTFCQKSGSEHSEKLWEMHKLAAEKGRYCPDHHKEEKLYPLTVGFARTGIARVCKLREWNDKLKMHIIADPPYDKELIPIYMSCAECDLYLDSVEEDNADILDGMCMNCFREQTEQTGTWYDIPPVLKGKQCTVCSINFFGRSDSDKCQKHRECKTCGLPFHTHTWQQKMGCGNVIFDPDWQIKKQAEEDANC